jgi:hypothetical protein
MQIFQVCHTDLNEQNLLTDDDRTKVSACDWGATQPAACAPMGQHSVSGPSNTHSTPPQIVGVLDWGDASYCWRVVDIAVAMAYGMLGAVAPAEQQPGAAAGADEPELDLLAVGRNILVSRLFNHGLGLLYWSTGEYIDSGTQTPSVQTHPASTPHARPCRPATWTRAGPSRPASATCCRRSLPRASRRA